MATPRSLLVDNQTPLLYHLVSRCVRRAWLCGTDPDTARNYDHRKDWLEKRLQQLVRCFAVELFGYAIMSNHFHLIVRYDPTAAQMWSDEEVADRWLICAGKAPDFASEGSNCRDVERKRLLDNPIKLARLRATLGSLSGFMKHLKQPIAVRANREDECSGHFFEGRFYSGALLDDGAVIGALAYVDLNPVRSNLVKQAVEATHTSLAHRLEELAADESRLQAYLGPIASGLDCSKPGQSLTLPITLGAYLDHLTEYSRERDLPEDKRSNWYKRVALFKHRQRAFGFAENINSWATKKGWSRIGLPCPR